MIKKLAGKSGMTLIEMLATILIMVLLVSGMCTGMIAGLNVYNDAAFENNSTALAANINTTLTDMLCYAQDIRQPEEAGAPAFVLTNPEHGLRNSYFQCDGNGILRICFWNGTGGSQGHTVVNSGAYSGLRIKSGSFNVQYVPDSHGGYFDVAYTIESTVDTEKTHDAKMVVRVLNH